MIDLVEVLGRVAADMPDDGPGPEAIRLRARRRTKKRRMLWSGVAIVLATIGIAVAVSTHGASGPADRVVAGPGPTSVQPTARQAAPTLPVLFSRTSPDGITVVARIGLVPVAATTPCPIGPPTTQQASTCPTEKAPGVQFDFSRGGHTYRVVVLDRDVAPATGPALRPMTTPAAQLEVNPDGSTRSPSEPTTAELSVLHANGIAVVRVNVPRGPSHGVDTMVPVQGWVAFPLVVARSSQFDDPVGLDAQGSVVATALPYRCC